MKMKEFGSRGGHVPATLTPIRISKIYQKLYANERKWIEKGKYPLRPSWINQW